MKPTSTFFQEPYLRYIQHSLNVSRQEVITTIRQSHVSAQQIATYLQKIKQKHQGDAAATDHPRRFFL